MQPKVENDGGGSSVGKTGRKIPPERCADLIRSNRKCLLEVIAAKGCFSTSTVNV